MLVRLNCWRGENNPGDVIEVPDQDAAALIHHGGASLVDDVPPASGRVVRGSAVLQSATGAGDGTP